jgi:hypothetical protein
MLSAIVIGCDPDPTLVFKVLACWSVGLRVGPALAVIRGLRKGAQLVDERLGNWIGRAVFQGDRPGRVASVSANRP